MLTSEPSQIKFLAPKQTQTTMGGGYRSHEGDPTDSHGRLRDSDRVNLQRMNGLGFDPSRPLNPTQLYSSHGKVHQGSFE